MSYNRKRGIKLDNDDEVPVKKIKGQKSRIQQEEDDGSSEEVPMKKTAPAQKAAAAQKAKKTEPSKGTDSEGNTYWEFGNNRRIGSSVFKNTTFVNIREYYNTPDGEARPGKKGISLNLDQYKALLKAIPQLNEELRSQGHEVEDPVAASTSSSSSVPAKSEKSSSKSTKAKKSNIEETSDEEEDDNDDMEEDDEDDDI